MVANYIRLQNILQITFVLLCMCDNCINILRVDHFWPSSYLIVFFSHPFVLCDRTHSYSGPPILSVNGSINNTEYSGCSSKDDNQFLVPEEDQIKYLRKQRSRVSALVSYYYHQPYIYILLMYFVDMCYI